MYINTDNIIFEKIWDDDLFTCASGLFEIKITAYNPYIKIKDFNLGMDKSLTKELSKKINTFIQNNEQISFTGGFNLDTSDEMIIEIKPTDVHGHVIILLKIENIDNNDNKNYAQLAIETEIGLLENFGNNILELINSGIGHKVSLNKELDWK